MNIAKFSFRPSLPFVISITDHPEQARSFSIGTIYYLLEIRICATFLWVFFFFALVFESVDAEAMVDPPE